VFYPLEPASLGSFQPIGDPGGMRAQPFDP
jgi:hypothetical protein